MSRVNVYLSEDTLKRLRAYVNHRFAGHRAFSAVVQQAIKEFLEKEETGGTKGTSARRD